MKPRKVYVQRKCSKRIRTVEELIDPTDEEVKEIIAQYRAIRAEGVWYFVSDFPCRNWI